MANQHPNSKRSSKGNLKSKQESRDYKEELRKSAEPGPFHSHTEDNRPRLPPRTECAYISILATGKHQLNDRVDGGVLNASDSPEMFALKMQIPKERF